MGTALKKLLNANGLTNVGKDSLRLYAFIMPLAAVHAVLVIVLLVLSLIFRSEEQAVAAAFLAVVPLFTACAFGIGKLLYRERVFGDSTVSPELYAVITEVLRSRGITNVRRHLIDHPEHVRQCLELGRQISSTHTSKNGYGVMAFQSLILTEDSRAEQTKEALLVIIRERGIKDVATARELLRTFTSAETPLMNGAL